METPYPCNTTSTPIIDRNETKRTHAKTQHVAGGSKFESQRAVTSEPRPIYEQSDTSSSTARAAGSSELIKPRRVHRVRNYTGIGGGFVAEYAGSAPRRRGYSAEKAVVKLLPNLYCVHHIGDLL
ncbi:unnamed protein product, partial [Iphiclides podalirius]